MRYLALTLPFLLAGCELFHAEAAPRKQGADQIVQGGSPERPRPDPVPVPPSSTGCAKTDLDAAVSKIEEKISSSNNANQNQITGLGANVNKLAEHLDASLLKMETNIPISVKNDLRNEMNANATATATANARLENTITAQNKMIAELHIKVGDLTNQLEASARGQVALQARMDETRNELKAGRDAFNVRTQMDENTLAALKDANSTLYWTQNAFCLVIIKIVMILGYRARSRSEKRYTTERDDRRDLTNKLMYHLGHREHRATDPQGGKPNAPQHA